MLRTTSIPLCLYMHIYISQYLCQKEIPALNSLANLSHEYWQSPHKIYSLNQYGSEKLITFYLPIPTLGKPGDTATLLQMNVLLLGTLQATHVCPQSFFLPTWIRDCHGESQSPCITGSKAEIFLECGMPVKNGIVSGHWHIQSSQLGSCWKKSE